MACEAISYGRFLKTENVRFRTAKPIINRYRSTLFFFRALVFDYHFREGRQQEVRPHFRTTSASEVRVWIWISTHRGRHKRSNEPKTAAQLHKPHLPSTAMSTPRRADGLRQGVSSRTNLSVYTSIYFLKCRVLCIMAFSSVKVIIIEHFFRKPQFLKGMSRARYSVGYAKQVACDFGRARLKQADLLLRHLYITPIRVTYFEV